MGRLESSIVMNIAHQLTWKLSTIAWALFANLKWFVWFKEDIRLKAAKLPPALKVALQNIAQREPELGYSTAQDYFELFIADFLDFDRLEQLWPVNDSADLLDGKRIWGEVWDIYINREGAIYHSKMDLLDVINLIVDVLENSSFSWSTLLAMKDERKSAIQQVVESKPVVIYKIYFSTLQKILTWVKEHVIIPLHLQNIVFFNLMIILEYFSKWYTQLVTKKNEGRLFTSTDFAIFTPFVADSRVAEYLQEMTLQFREDNTKWTFLKTTLQEMKASHAQLRDSLSKENILVRNFFDGFFTQLGFDI